MTAVEYGRAARRDTAARREQMADDSSPAHTAKKPRTDGTDNVTLLFKDSAGGTRGMTIACSMVPRVPYLETMLSTGIGAQQDAAATRQINLPEGCTASAAAALLLLLDGFGLACGNMDAAIELLRTADFLMMKEMMPAAVLQCHRNIRAPEDLAKLMSIESASVEVQQMRQTLTGGALVNAMGIMEVCAMVKAMRQCDTIAAGQASTLVRWLSVGGRTIKEINDVMDHGSLATVYDVAGTNTATFRSFFFTAKVDPSYHRRYTMELKSGATQLLEQLGGLAARRPDFDWDHGKFGDRDLDVDVALMKNYHGHNLIECVLGSAIPREIDMHQFKSSDMAKYLDAFVSPFHADASARQLTELIPMLARFFWGGPYTQRASHHLYSLVDRPYPYSLEEMKLVLPQLMRMPTRCDCGSQAVSAITNSEVAAHSFAVDLITARTSPPKMEKLARDVTVRMLASFESGLQAKVVAHLMPYFNMPDGRAVSKEVREYIENALESGDL